MKRVFALLLLLLLASTSGCVKKRRSVVEKDFTRSQEEWLAMEPVRLLRDYVRIDTTAERGEEEGAKFLKQLFDCADIESEIVCPAPRRCNLLARLPGRKREGALLLLNHIDVAPVSSLTWTAAQPFEGKIQRGYLFGRGTYDMKSLGLAQALAIRNLKFLGIVPESDILFLGEADEEVGQKWGSRWLLEHRPDWFRGVDKVLNEGGVIEVVLRDPRFWGIETLQTGFAIAEFESTDRAALEALAGRWKKLPSPHIEPHPHVRIGFDLLANHLPSPLTDPLRHLDRVIRDPKELALLPDRYGAFLEVRAFWSAIFPGPPKSNLFISATVISTPPGVDTAGYLTSIVDDAKARGIRVARSFSGGPSPASPYPTPFTRLLETVTSAHYPGVPSGPLPAFGVYTSSVHFRQRGFPTYGYTSIPMNITDTVRRHSRNERIYLRDYLRGIDLYADVLEAIALESNN